MNKSLKKNGDVVNNMAQHEHNNIKCYSSTLRHYIIYINLLTNFFKKCPTPSADQGIICNL